MILERRSRREGNQAMRWLTLILLVLTATSLPAGAAMAQTGAVVTTPGDGFLSLRSEPGTKGGRRLVKIPHGTLLTLDECDRSTGDDVWCRTSYAGMRGWVYNKYLSYDLAQSAPAVLRAVAQECTPNWCKAEVDQIIGDFATVLFRCLKPNCEGAIAFLRREKGRWTLVDYGTGLTPDDLVGYGFPRDVVRHLVQ